MSVLRQLTTIVACLAAASAFAQSPPPIAPGTASESYFGTTVADPYRALENAKDPDVAKWFRQQADYTRATLDKIPQRQRIYDEIVKYGDAASARVTTLQVSNDYIYYEKRLANENVPKIYVRRGYAGAERLLVDPDALGMTDGKHNAIDYYAPSQDNKYLAYGVSIGGSENSVLHVVDVATGKETGDVIDRAQYGSPSWLPDNRLVYSRLQQLAADSPVTDRYQNQRVYVHKLGTTADQDVALLGAKIGTITNIAPTELVFAFNPVGSRYLIGTVVNGVQREIKFYAVPLAALAGADTPWKQVTATTDDVTDGAIIGDNAYLITHKDAARFKLLKVSLANPDLAHAEVVLPASESVITGVAAAKDALYVRRMNAGISELMRVGYAQGAKAQKLRLPFDGDIDSIASDPRRPGLAFYMGGWTKLGGWYAYDPRTGKVADTRLQPSGPYDNPTDLVSTEVKARAADGTLIPMSIVHKRGIKLDGSNPTILYGYGAYGISQTPFYRPTFLPWFERGGVFAVAHVRGGGEFGEDWYKAGYKATKPNTWRDAIACAEWLVANKYTSPSKMAIMGGSAGGIFVGRSITERPDLFGAAIDEVPASDMIRMEQSANGVPNIPEFGSAKDAEGFKALYAMSAYYNIKDGEKYPAVLLTTGINDPRVDAWQAAKMAARLQAASKSGKPILLRIDYDAGHGIGSTKTQAYQERADIFAFLFWQFGVSGFAAAAGS